MLRNLPWVGLCVALVCGAAPASAATCAPPTLLHIITVDVTPGITSQMFAAQPKGLYRIGSDKMRVEEAPDPANGIHGLVVVAEPNIWMANLLDNTGKHIVDPGPTFFVKAPVFGIAGLSPRLLDLELGCEAAYLAANAPKAVRSEQLGGAAYLVYRVDDNPDAVEILEKSGSNTPAFARYFHQGKLELVLRYDLYSTGLQSNPDLFTPPSSVHFSETK